MSHDVERSTRRRRRGVRVASIMMMTIVSGAVIASTNVSAGRIRAVDVLRIVAFTALVLAVTLRSTTSFSFTPTPPELNDELTVANRAAAAKAGFLALMVALIAGYVCSLFTPLSIAELAPPLLFVGAVVAGLRFSQLEMRGDERE